MEHTNPLTTTLFSTDTPIATVVVSEKTLPDSIEPLSFSTVPKLVGRPNTPKRKGWLHSWRNYVNLVTATSRNKRTKAINGQTWYVYCQNQTIRLRRATQHVVCQHPASFTSFNWPWHQIAYHPTTGLVLGHLDRTTFTTGPQVGVCWLCQH